MQSRKSIWTILCILMALLLSGCSPIVEDIPQKTDIYTTFYPLCALTQWVAEGAENVEIHCLVQPQDDCLRLYELSDWDLYMLGYSADAVIAAGNGLESFADKLHEMGEKILPVADVLLGIPMERFPHVQSNEESHFYGDNPHVYMSLTGAGAIIDNVAGALSIFDADNANIYEENRLKAQNKLDAIYSRVRKQTDVCANIDAAVLHESLLYPAIECGLNISAVFERESGEMLYTSSLDECLSSLKSADVQVVLLENQAPKALVDVLISEGYVVVQLDVLSTHRDIDGIVGYINAITNNAQLIIDACKKLAPKYNGGF